jgi:hypothetical protein
MPYTVFAEPLIRAFGMKLFQARSRFALHKLDTVLAED